RSAWAGEYRVYPNRGPTDAELDAEHANMQAVADFIQRHHVRVVDLSAYFSMEYLEGQLRHETGRYRSADEVVTRARQVPARRRGFWQEFFSRGPDPLFLVASGDENADVVEYETLPACIDAPNVLAVGAVDRFGEWAIFTNSNPERVRVFELGV